MAALSLTYTITNGTTEDAVQVQQNYTDIKNYINNNVMRTDGATAMAAALVTNDADPTLSAHAVRKAYLDGAVAIAKTPVSQTFTAGVFKTILYTTEVRDADNGANTATNYNLATGLFTAPRTGLYFVSHSATFIRAINVYQLGVLAGGTLWAGPSFQGDLVQSVGTPSMSMGIAVYVTSGQTIEPQASMSGGATQSIGNWMTIAWLHA